MHFCPHTSSLVDLHRFLSVLIFTFLLTRVILGIIGDNSFFLGDTPPSPIASYKLNIHVLLSLFSLLQTFSSPVSFPSSAFLFLPFISLQLCTHCSLFHSLSAFHFCYCKLADQQQAQLTTPLGVSIRHQYPTAPCTALPAVRTAEGLSADSFSGRDPLKFSHYLSETSSTVGFRPLLLFYSSLFLSFLIFFPL